MTGKEILILTGSLLVAIVILFAVRRYPRLRVKLRVLGFGEGQLSGEDHHNDKRKVGGFVEASRVATTVGGNVQDSHIVTTGGALGATRGGDNVSTVRTDVTGSVKGSDIKTIGGDFIDK